MMERLAIDDREQYLAIEAAIHVNRYAIARSLCPGKRVLDIACGEGYGSYLLGAHWGAAEVVGIDISTEAVEKADRFFRSDNVSFTAGSAEELDSLVEAQSFDLIVCLETFEHVSDPSVMLRNFRQALKPDGIVIISCPNDHWYYRSEGEGNPFHARKYRFDEFKQITQTTLGEAASFLFGMPLSGFINVNQDSRVLSPGSSYLDELRQLHESPTTTVPIAPSEMISESNCAYFMGVWGSVDKLQLSNATYFPTSMDQHLLAHKLFDSQNLSDEVRYLRGKVFDLETDLRLSCEQLAHSEKSCDTDGSIDQKPPSHAAIDSVEVVGLPLEVSRDIRDKVLSDDEPWTSDDASMTTADHVATTSASTINGDEVARLHEEMIRLRRHSTLKQEAFRAENDYLRGECLTLREDLISRDDRLAALEQQAAELQAQLQWHRDFLSERCAHIATLEKRLASLKTPSGIFKAVTRKVRSALAGSGPTRKALSNT